MSDEKLTPRILQEVLAERGAQDVKWGGSDHDDTQRSHDWIAYIVRYTGKAVTWPFDIATFRTQMIRVAALAVAAVEWSDRSHFCTLPEG